MRETKINKGRGELLLNLKKAIGFDLIVQQRKACKKYYYERISDVNFEDKLELEYVKLPHFFNRSSIWIILYLLPDYSIPKQSLSFFIIY